MKVVITVCILIMLILLLSLLLHSNVVDHQEQEKNYLISDSSIEQQIDNNFLKVYKL